MGHHPESVLRGASLPRRLQDLRDCPSALYVQGELPRSAAVTIVGTRYPSPAGRKYARSLAAELAQAGVAILSGGAKGIDVAAHRGALDAGGVTVVVAPSGWNHPSPPEHRRLFERIVCSGGAHVSLVPPAGKVMYANYFARNAVLAALAHVVVVVEAPFKSGARNTSKVARRLGRPLFVCAAPPWSKTGRGCTEELRLGARPLTSIKDVLRQLAEERAHAVALAPALGPAAAAQLLLPGAPDEAVAKSDRYDPGRKEGLMETIKSGVVYPDDLCARTGLEPRELQELLLTLRLDGVLVCDASGRIIVVNKRNH